jgi:hypothetical protein
VDNIEVDFDTLRLRSASLIESCIIADTDKVLCIGVSTIDRMDVITPSWHFEFTNDDGIGWIF